MTHPWREHIKLTKEKNPTINNFGEIIKLAKQTYTKSSNKKTQKKSNSEKNKKTLKKSVNLFNSNIPNEELLSSGKDNKERDSSEIKGNEVHLDLNQSLSSDKQDIIHNTVAKEIKEEKQKEHLDKNSHTGGGKIFADHIDKDGTKRRYKAIKEGECIFPFKYNNKTYEESDGCADSRDGKWCATSLNKKGYSKTWGYCETHLKNEQTKKIEDSSSTSEESSSENDEIVTKLLEYEGDKYLLEDSTRNIYSLPEEDGSFYFIGRFLPNGTIYFKEDGAEEYEPSKKK